MKKTLFITLFILINVLLSCNKDETCPPTDPYFRIKSIYAQNLTQDEPHSPIIQPIDTVDIQELFIRVYFNSDYYSKLNKVNTSGGNLFALSCLERGYKGSQEGLKKLDIITLYDFNADYLANDTISTIATFGNQRYDTEFVSKSEYIEQNQTTFRAEKFDFRITGIMENDFQTASFKVVMKLTNGEVFESISDSIVLKK